MPQKKKLSLEEARAIFSDPNDKSKKPRRSTAPRNQGAKTSYKSTPGRSTRPSSSRPQLSPDQIQERIERLERKIEHEDLTLDEEEKLLNEIDKYEKMIAKAK